MAAIVSVVPIILLITLMMGLKITSWKSALTALVVTLLLALFVVPSLGIVPEQFDGISITVITLWSVVEGLLRAIFPILLVIICAIFSYNVLRDSKEIETIKSQFTHLSTDKGLLVLLLTWGFGGMLEGMAGFGMSVAIPAAILISLGFKPMFSAVVCMVANTVPVGFGAVGLPVTTLAGQVAGGAASGAMIREISIFVIMQTVLMFYITPFVILSMTGRRQLVKNVLLSLFVGTFTLVGQLCAAIWLGVDTPTIIGSLAGIAAMLIYNKFFLRDKSLSDEVYVQRQRFTLGQTLRAWSVYGLIVFFILVSSRVVPPVNDLLHSTLVTTFTMPAIGTTFTFSWLSNAALMVFLGTVIGGMIQGLSVVRLLKVLCWTAYGLRRTVLTICCLVVLAVLMNNTGMTLTIATGLVAITGPGYPFFAPLIGAIGTFVMGSATSSNILFGKLQAAAAGHLGLVNDGFFFGIAGDETNWLAAANCGGSEGGKALSPQSIAVATASCNMEGQDGEIMRRTLPYVLFWIFINGLMVFLGLYLI